MMRAAELRPLSSRFTRFTRGLSSLPASIASSPLDRPSYSAQPADPSSATPLRALGEGVLENTRARRARRPPAHPRIPQPARAFIRGPAMRDPQDIGTQKKLRLCRAGAVPAPAGGGLGPPPPTCAAAAAPAPAPASTAAAAGGAGGAKSQSSCPSGPLGHLSPKPASPPSAAAR
jgi:hypothetical protein